MTEEKRKSPATADSSWHRYATEDRSVTYSVGRIDGENQSSRCEVSVKFCLPEFAVVFGEFVVALWAAVPEAAHDEDGELF